jgi:hypothetical protein
MSSRGSNVSVGRQKDVILLKTSYFWQQTEACRKVIHLALERRSTP